MKPYKLCHLLYEEFPRDPRVRRYVNALNSAGIHCVIICSKKRGDKFFENWKGNRVYRIPVAKQRQSFFLTSIEYTLFTWTASVLLFYLWLRYRFKIIQVHTLPDFLIFAALPEKVFGTKIILDLHELFPELFTARKPQLANSFWVKILKFVEKLSIKLANAVITIHDNAKEIFVKRLDLRGAERRSNLINDNTDLRGVPTQSGRRGNPSNETHNPKITVIMNTVDPSEFGITKSSPLLTKEGIEGRTFIIIYNGTVVKLLNLTMIVNALNILKNKMPPNDFNKIKFLIYGDGPALNEIFQTAENLNLKDKVEYKGFIPPDKMYNEILKASVLILPPLKNIYSDLFYTIKLIEMIYLKIPVIATRLDTYKRYYSEDALFYFDSGNVEQLAEKIKEVFYNKDLVKSKTETAFAEYQSIGWDIMKDRYLALIKNLTSEF